MKRNPRAFEQLNLFQVNEKMEQPCFASVYRISLVKDRHVSFEQTPLCNSVQAQRILKELIRSQGQSDREQFCVILLNAKNVMIGLNIVSTGSITSATVYPREVVKPAILANACAMILCHNHPSNDVTPSEADIAVTRKIIQASKLLDIQVHEHLIISMDNDCYYSFADHGIISEIYGEID